MCIIAVKPKGLPVWDDETIRIMYRKNPDGAGLMYFDPVLKKVHCEKGFNSSEELIVRLNLLDKEYDLTRLNIVTHFRIGTSGLKDALNCHPYPIYEDNKPVFNTDLAMCHNGILSDYNPPKDAKFNDTQNFIKQVLSKLNKNFLYDSDKKLLISELIGSNKLCFINSNDEIITIGNFINDDGYLYSNGNYKETFYFTNFHLDNIPSIKNHTDECKPFEYDEPLKVITFNNEKEIEDYIADYGLMQVDENLYVDEYELYYELEPEDLTMIVS